MTAITRVVMLTICTEPDQSRRSVDDETTSLHSRVIVQHKPRDQGAVTSNVASKIAMTRCYPNSEASRSTVGDVLQHKISRATIQLLHENFLIASQQK